MMLKKIQIPDIILENGKYLRNFSVSYQRFGTGSENLVVLHALTGNSDAFSEKGWWNQIYGEEKLVSPSKYTSYAFNIPGNGYDGFFWEDTKQVTAKDISKIILAACFELKLFDKKQTTIIGGSLGGCLIWEALALAPDKFKTAIIVAGDWKCTDWAAAINAVQLHILKDKENGMFLARMLSMIFFRTPNDFKRKFQRSLSDKGMKNVESWLIHHGNKLTERFSSKAYAFLTNLILSLDVEKNNSTFEEIFKNLETKIIQIGIDSDIYFPAQENIETHQRLVSMKKDSEYFEIKSEYGHDAFLIEYQQITNFLKAYL